MSTQAIIRRDDASLSISFTETAVALKTAALESAALVGKVTGAFEQQSAVEVQQKISDTLSLVEKARKAAKEPVLQFGRTIDEAARQFVQELKEEQLRIATLVGDFQALEAAKARAAEQLRLAEERKAQEERHQAELAALRAAQEEKAKLAEKEREIARLASEARSKRERDLLAVQQAEIDRQKALSEANTHAELDRIQEQHSNAMAAIADQPKYEPVRAAGQQIRDDWEVTINDIHTLYRHHPNCVKLEALMSEIKSLLKAGTTPKGVTAKPIVKAGVTRARMPGAIDIQSQAA